MGFVVGDSVTFAKTVSESDVYLFAGVTGDLAPNHVDSTYMARTTYGERIAHGVLVLGYSSAASTRMLAKAGADAVSYGYDRVRFTAPVFFGDTITVHYEVERIDEAERKVYNAVRVSNQDGVLCLVATHILKLIEAGGAG
ncbi:MAG: dehydratase [Actinobacteria bacterium 13_1_20CM_3_71_11]|nr:MAG: dehydratase [Actinobacteria bacterium 13_1_20CM_3_71_11]